MTNCLLIYSQQKGKEGKVHNIILTIEEKADAHLWVSLSRCVGQKGYIQKGLSDNKIKECYPHTAVNMQKWKVALLNHLKDLINLIFMTFCVKMGINP